MSGTVLAVDDDPDTLGMLTGALEGAGYVPLVALGGERGLEIAASAPVDLVLLDASMPELDGFETCRRMRRSARGSTLPVIFMTGLAQTEHVIAGLEAGAVDYVTKPLVLRELLARIAVHLAGARAMRSAVVAIERSGHALFAADAGGRVLWATPRAEMLVGRAGIGAEVLAAWLAGERERLEVATAGGVLEVSCVGAIGGEILLRVEEARASRDEAALQNRLRVTKREAEVLLWLCRGKTNRDIAEILGLSPRTVNKHLEQAYAKMGVENRAAAVAQTLGVLRG